MEHLSKLRAQMLCGVIVVALLVAVAFGYGRAVAHQPTTWERIVMTAEDAGSWIVNAPRRAWRWVWE